MPFDRDTIILRDMHQIVLAHNFVEGLDLDGFKSDVLRQYGVTRCLEIISEASRRLSDSVKARHPSIPWREMAGAGNVYRHRYEDVAPGRLWDTVQLALPPLRLAVEVE